MHAFAVGARTDNGLVFTTTVGTPIEPRNISRSFEQLCDRSGVRKIRLHDLRVRHEAPCIRAG